MKSLALVGLLALLVLGIVAGPIQAQRPVPFATVELRDSFAVGDTAASAIREDTAFSAVFDLCYAPYAPKRYEWKYFYPGLLQLSEESAFTRTNYYVALITGQQVYGGGYYWTDTLNIDTFTAAAYSICTRRLRADSALFGTKGRFRLIRIDTNEAALPGAYHDAVYIDSLRVYPKILDN